MSRVHGYFSIIDRSRVDAAVTELREVSLKSGTEFVEK